MHPLLIITQPEGWASVTGRDIHFYSKVTLALGRAPPVQNSLEVHGSLLEHVSRPHGHDDRGEQHDERNHAGEDGGLGELLKEGGA